MNRVGKHIVESQDAHNQRRRIDTIIYLASLSSDFNAINPILDTMRIITAKIGNTGTPDSDDIKRLTSIEAKLRKYLINDDPVRTFTPASLQSALDKHFQQPNHRTTLAKYITATIIWLIILCIIVALLPFDFTQKAVSLPVLGVVSLFIYIPWAYLSSLKDFNPTLKTAYKWFCTGFIVIGIGSALAILPAVFPEIINVVLFRYGTIPIIFVASDILIYYSIWKLATALNVRAQEKSIPKIIPVYFLISIFIILLPHPTTEPSEAYFDFTIISYFAMFMLLVHSAALAHRISKVISKRYTKSVSWLSISLFGLAAASLITGAYTFFTGQANVATYAIVAIIYTIPGLASVASAAYFKQQQQ